MVVNILFPISSTAIEGFSLKRKMTFPEKKKTFIIFLLFLLPAFLTFLMLNGRILNRIIIAFPAFALFVLSSCILFSYSKAENQSNVRECLAAALYLLELGYSISTLYFFLFPDTLVYSTISIIQIYGDFLFWSLISILAGYRIHYSMNKRRHSNKDSVKNISWNIVTVIGVILTNTFIKLFGTNNRYEIAQIVVFVVLMCTFMFLSVGIFDFRRTQYYMKTRDGYM